MHPLSFIILAVLNISAIFLANTYLQYFLLLCLTYLDLLILNRYIKYNALVKFILTMIPVFLAILASNYLFGVNTSAKLGNALLISIRYFCLSVIAFAFSLHTPYQKVFDYLIEHKILNVKIGYAILAAFNSLPFLAKEFRRIQIAYKMRLGKIFFSPSIFISILTSAARYAHNLSISMYSRGLNRKKTFAFPVNPISYKDYMLWLANFVAIVLLLNFYMI